MYTLGYKFLSPAGIIFQSRLSLRRRRRRRRNLRFPSLKIVSYSCLTSALLADHPQNTAMHYGIEAEELQVMRIILFFRRRILPAFPYYDFLFTSIYLFIIIIIIFFFFF